MAQLVGVSSHKLKGRRFDSWSGHITRLLAWFPVEAHRANQSMSVTWIFLSHSPSFALSLKSTKICLGEDQKIIKIKNKYRRTKHFLTFWKVQITLTPNLKRYCKKNNLRSRSLMTIAAKILNKVLANHIYKYTKKNKALPSECYPRDAKQV